MKSRRKPAPGAAAPTAPAHTGKPPHAPGVPAGEDGADLPLPHERDESIGSTNPEPDPLIEQAGKDLESGQVDTDVRGTPGLDAERRRRILREGR